MLVCLSVNMQREVLIMLRFTIVKTFCFLFLLSLPPQAKAKDRIPSIERKTEWHGHQQVHFKVAGKNAYLVEPAKPLPGNPWIWRARFPGYHAEMDIELVKQGFHIGYVDVAGLFGSPQAIAIGEKFYDFVTGDRALSKRPAMEGVSRGGLFVYCWAACHPDKVACIYCDTPVLDFKSWPGGKGDGLGAAKEWKQCQTVYGLSEEQALKYELNPVDHLEPIAKANIPILHVVSLNDQVVPVEENTSKLAKQLRALGRAMDVIYVSKGTKKSHGHHFEHPDPEHVIKFISTHATKSAEASGVSGSEEAIDLAARMMMLRRAKTIIFLGDSITMQGHYVSQFEAWLLQQRLPKNPSVINVGLSSETVSGLSEDGHAGGRFPRPDLAERLDRVLALTQPDLVFACYGINCGIYQPFDEQRFAAYKNGIQQLRKKVEDAGAQLVLITPPTFDDARKKNDFSYNAVLDRYSEWLVSQRGQGWTVIDLHSVMSQALSDGRKADPKFTFQPDGVHPNMKGHRFMATQLVQWFGGAEATLPDEELIKAVGERMQLLRNTYLFNAGHKRPGVAKGLPIAWAKDRAKGMTEKIEELLK